MREHRWCSDSELLERGAPGLCANGNQRGGSIQVLLVDDSDDDRRMLRRELERAFKDCVLVEIRSAAGLSAALSSDTPVDLLITDYQLFWSDGISVVRSAREVWPDLPVLMFTGSGNEEVAVEAMKAGAFDYVTKSPRNYERVITAVRNSLQSQEAHRNHLASEARYTNLFDTVPVGLFRSTPHGVLLDANPALASILGCERDKLVGRNFSELHPDPDGFASWRDQLEREGAVAWVQSRFQTANGQLRWVEIHAKALRDAATGDVFYEGSIEDITRDKEADAERDQLIQRLQAALGKVRTLTGLLPICSSCKKIRDNHGRWNMLESFIETHSHAHFTHSFCPECARRLYPEVFLDTPKI